MVFKPLFPDFSKGLNTRKGKLNFFSFHFVMPQKICSIFFCRIAYWFKTVLYLT